MFDSNLFNHINNEEKFEGTKGVIKNRKSKDRQYNAYYKIINVVCCVIY